MAYKKIPTATIRSAINAYGRSSREHGTILLVADARLPYECIADLLLLDAEAVKQDLSGELQLDDAEHALLHNCLKYNYPIGH